MSFSASPEIINRTLFALEPAFLSDEEGHAVLVPIVKATFMIQDDGSLQLGGEQVPVDLVGTYWGEPDVSSYRFEPECAFVKLATDVVLIGHAYPAESGATTTVAGIRVGSLSKSVRVSGNRYWTKGSLGIIMTPPEPFERIPLIYENAFGGWDRSDPDTSKHTFEPRNPVGLGFRARWNANEPLVRVANIEDAQQLITAFNDRPLPSGFGFLSPHWQPRASLAGTYDANWMEQRMPLLPRDFDRRYFNAASPGLVAPAYLRGDEAVTVIGASPRGRLDFHLPGAATPRVTVALRGQNSVTLNARFDTLIVDTDTRSVMLLWRAAIRVKEVPRDVLSVIVECDGYAVAAAAP